MGSEAQLVVDIRAFIHRYVDFGESFENVGTHYVLLTWLYDAFNKLPYFGRQSEHRAAPRTAAEPALWPAVPPSALKLFLNPI